MAFYQAKPIRFECTQCGQCCFGGKYAYVRATEQEIQNIISFLNIDTNTFKAKYLSKLVDHGYGIKMTTPPFAKLLNKKRHCVLLNKQGKCSVYSVRPTQCRTYPFWPEILTTEEKWNNEVNRCEGIHKGNEVDINYIEQQQKLSVEAEFLINDSNNPN